MKTLEALEEALKADPDAVRGKIVFFSRRTVKGETGPGYGANVPMRSSGAAKAGPHGALAVLVRSIGTSTSRFAHTGSTNYADGGPRIPAAAVSNADADLLERLLARGPVKVRLVLGCRPLPPATSANVIAEVTGREKPDEVVVVSGHLDSWDLGTGAIDDGAGCAIAIEAARLIAEGPRRPRRTIRVVLYANEESGLAGGKGYAARHAAELPKHAGAFEADSGTGAPQGFSWNAADTLEPALAAVAKLLEPLGAGTLRKGGHGGADISPMAPAGVPLFGLRQETGRYFDFHHSADDTFDKIEPASLDKAAAALAAMAYAVADLPEIHARPSAPRSRSRDEPAVSPFAPYGGRRRAARAAARRRARGGALGQGDALRLLRGADRVGPREGAGRLPRRRRPPLGARARPPLRSVAGRGAPRRRGGRRGLRGADRRRTRTSSASRSSSTPSRPSARRP